MAGFISRLFGRKSKDKDNDSPVSFAIREPLKRSVPRRIPAALSTIPLADVTIGDSEAPRNSWLDLSLDTTVFSPPVSPVEYGNYVVVDVETTGLDPVSAEIVEVSALRFEGFKPVSLFSALVRPVKVTRIPTSASEVNHLSYDDVADAPTFTELRESLQKFIDAAPIVVGHNLPFDVRFLFHAGICFSPEKLYVDTLYNSKNYLGYKGLFSPPRLTSFRLEDLCSFYQISLDDAHVSAADCLATGLVYHALLDDMSKYEPPKQEHEPTEQDYVPAEHIPIKSIVPQVVVDPNSPVFGKKIVFTGELSIGRREAMQMAVDAGMKLMASVTPKTDYLVRGTYLNPEYQTRKYEKALELNENGTGHIQIITESDFFSMIGKEVPV